MCGFIALGIVSKIIQNIIYKFKYFFDFHSFKNIDIFSKSKVRIQILRAEMEGITFFFTQTLCWVDIYYAYRFPVDYNLLRNFTLKARIKDLAMNLMNKSAKKALTFISMFVIIVKT